MRGGSQDDGNWPVDLHWSLNDFDIFCPGSGLAIFLSSPRTLTTRTA